MRSGGSRADSSVGRIGGIPLTATFAFGYVIAIVLMALLFHRVWTWALLAMTRLLDILMRAGIVARTDADAGLILGLPSHELYLMATDPVDWGLVLGAIGLYFLYYAITSARFHIIARFTGVAATLGQSARSYMYGTGLSHLLPLNVGNVAIASALEGEGAPRDRAAQAVFINRVFVLFEILAFAVIGLYLLGWSTWVPMMYWPVLYLFTAYMLVRPAGQRGIRSIGAGLKETAVTSGHVFGALLRQPLTLIALILLSLTSFFLVDMIVYVLSQAYTGFYVLLNMDPKHLLMGVVGARIARYIQITPGGIGQGEWGFCMALYMAGEGFGAAATIALVWGQARYISVLLVMAFVVFGRGVSTTLSRVTATFRGAELPPVVVGDIGPQPAGAGGTD